MPANSYPHMIFGTDAAELTKDSLAALLAETFAGRSTGSSQTPLKLEFVCDDYPFTFWFEDAERVGEMYVDYLPEGTRRRPLTNASTVVDMSGAPDDDGRHADDADQIAQALARVDGVLVFSEASKRFVGLPYGDEPVAVPTLDADSPAAVIPSALPPEPEPALAPVEPEPAPAAADPEPTPAAAEADKRPTAVPSRPEPVEAAPFDAAPSGDEAVPTESLGAHDEPVAPDASPVGDLLVAEDDVIPPTPDEPTTAEPTPAERDAEIGTDAQPEIDGEVDPESAPAPTPEPSPEPSFESESEPDPQPEPVGPGLVPAATEHAQDAPSRQPVLESEPTTEGEPEQKGGFLKRLFGRR